MMVCVLDAGIKQMKEKEILRNEHENVDKIKKDVKLADLLN